MLKYLVILLAVTMPMFAEWQLQAGTVNRLAVVWLSFVGEDLPEKLSSLQFVMRFRGEKIPQLMIQPELEGQTLKCEGDTSSLTCIVFSLNLKPLENEEVILSIGSYANDASEFVIEIPEVSAYGINEDVSPVDIIGSAVVIKWAEADADHRSRIYKYRQKPVPK